MLPEISLNVLDITQNSISAESTLIRIQIAEDTVAKLLTVEIVDNGRGMDADMVASVTDPFFTTRTTRSVGLGIPFFKTAAEATGGSLQIESKPGKGTKVVALFHTDHIDCMPLGDINETILTLVTTDKPIDFIYRRSVDKKSFELDTREARTILGDVPFSNMEVRAFFESFLEDNESEVKG